MYIIFLFFYSIIGNTAQTVQSKKLNANDVSTSQQSTNSSAKKRKIETEIAHIEDNSCGSVSENQVQRNVKRLNYYAILL